MALFHPGPQLNVSILCGTDHRTGWGNTCFFTYFSEFQRSSLAWPALETSLLVLLSILAIAANVSVFAHISDVGGSTDSNECRAGGEGGGGGAGGGGGGAGGRGMRRELSVTNLFVCNMAAADLLFNVTAPLVAVTRLTESWVLGPVLCHFNVYNMFVCGTVTIWSLCLISIDRYNCIVRQPRRQPMKSRGAYVAIAIVWLCTLTSFLPLAHYFIVRKVNLGLSRVEICTLAWPHVDSVRLSVVFLCIVAVIAFIVPLFIITVCYTLVFRAVMATSRQVAPGRPTLVAQWRSNAATRRQQRDLRVVKTLVLLVVVFLFMWFPIFAIVTLIVVDMSFENMRLSSKHLMAVYYLAQCNTGVNALLYGLVLDRLRRRLASLKLLLTSRCACRKLCSRRSRPEASPAEVPEMNGSVSVSVVIRGP